MLICSYFKVFKNIYFYYLVSKTVIFDKKKQKNKHLVATFYKNQDWIYLVKIPCYKRWSAMEDILLATIK